MTYIPIKTRLHGVTELLTTNRLSSLISLSSITQHYITDWTFSATRTYAALRRKFATKNGNKLPVEAAAVNLSRLGFVTAGSAWHHTPCWAIAGRQQRHCRGRQQPAIASKNTVEILAKNVPHLGRTRRPSTRRRTPVPSASIRTFSASKNAANRQ